MFLKTRNNTLKRKIMKCEHIGVMSCERDSWEELERAPTRRMTTQLRMRLRASVKKKYFPVSKFKHLCIFES
jgi:hypothetical protein